MEKWVQTITKAELSRFGQRLDAMARKREESRLIPRFLAWVTRCMMVPFLSQGKSKEGRVEGRGDSRENLNSLIIMLGLGTLLEAI